MPKAGIDIMTNTHASDLAINREKNEVRVETPIDLAKRVVSPGIPSLSDEMKSTMKISKRISEQQKTLIRAILPDGSHGNRNTSNKVTVVEGESSNGSKANQVEQIVSNGSKSLLEESADTIKSPNDIKRLKRNNKPTPLSLPEEKHNPTIQSAPGWYQKVPSTARYVRRRAFPYQYHETNVPRYYSIKEPYFVPQPMNYIPHYATIMPQRRLRATPRSTSQRSRTRIFRRKPTQDQNLAQKGSDLSESVVTDVYIGNYTKAAPLSSQPLSAQRSAFDLDSKPNREYCNPGSEEEMLSTEDYGSDVESIALDEDEKQIYSQNEELFGSINFMNEVVFSFKIFSGNSKTELSDEGLEKEKENFLKICETSWNEYMNSRQ